MHHTPPNRSRKKKSYDDTPTSTRMIMVLCAFAILGVLYYFFGQNAFPREITYRNVGGSGTTFVLRRENPQSHF